MDRVAHPVGRSLCRRLRWGAAFRVDVVGTEFVVERSKRCVDVGVREGAVRVRSDLLDGERYLMAEQSLEVCQDPDHVEEEPRPDDDRPDIEAAEADASHAARPEWRSLASSGEYIAAYEILGARGVRQMTEQALTVAEFMELADVARLSGHPSEAVSPLERVLERYPDDHRAPVAAFTLGRIQADSLSNHQRASRAFSRCLELGPPRALREDAYARLAETYARSGYHQRAKTVAREYLRLFPSGRRAQDLSRWLEPQ